MTPIVILKTAISKAGTNGITMVLAVLEFYAMDR